MYNINATRHTFKQFDPFVTSLLMSETDIRYKDDKFTFIDEIFRLIQKRCTVGSLKSIEIILDRKEDQHTVTIVPDVFKGVELLSIFTGSRKNVVQLDNLMGSVISKCSELCCLSLFGIAGNWIFLVSPQLQTLNTLCISHCQIPHTAWSNFVVTGIHSLCCLILKINPLYSNLPESSKQNSISENFVRDIGRAFPNLAALILSLDEPTILAQNICDIQQRFSNLFLLIIDIDKGGKFTHSSFHLIEHQFQHLPSLNRLELKAYLENETITAIVAASRNLHVLKNDSKRQITWKFYNSLVIERLIRFPDAQPLHKYTFF